jgi:hypothetical protein
MKDEGGALRPADEKRRTRARMKNEKTDRVSSPIGFSIDLQLDLIRAPILFPLARR